MISRIFDVIARRIDGPLMAALALTLALGLTVVYSASAGLGRAHRRPGAQPRARLVHAVALRQVHPQC